MTRSEFNKLKKAAEAGNVESMHNLGIAYQEGDGVKKNLKTSFNWAKKAAEAGNAESMFSLAISYLNGDRIRKNTEEFFNWAKKAAKAGNADAMQLFAILYQYGIVVNKDLKASFNWTKKAAEAGNVDAMQSLGVAYEKGVDLNKNLKESFSWTKKAAEKGNPGAIQNLAIKYLAGTGTRRNFKRYKQCVRDAINAGSPKAFILSGMEKIKRIKRPKYEILPKLYSGFVELFNVAQKIKREKHLLKKDTKRSVAHFTTLEALKKMLPIISEGEGSKQGNDVRGKGNHLRIYNVSYVNDPQEGRRLIEAGRDKGHPICNFFRNETGHTDRHYPIAWGKEEYSVYVGSFTLEIDRLDLWRAYGRDGEGFCIVTPLDAFDQKSQAERHEFQAAISTELKTEVEPKLEKEVQNTSAVQNTLYKVIYDDKDVEKTLETLKPYLAEIEKIKNRLDNVAQEQVRNIVSVILSELLYLYKNEEYSAEKEARIISIFNITDNERLELDEREPRRVFAKTKNILFEENNSSVYIGPKVAHKIEAELEIKYRLAAHGFSGKTKVKRSTISYR